MSRRESTRRDRAVAQERCHEPIHGVLPAKVQALDDEEGLGRVKLLYPTLGDDVVSDWVRLGPLYAGAGRGAFFVPELGDEVLVMFLDGHIDRPRIVGSLWSTSATPPVGGDEENDHKEVHTRSDHVWHFDESEQTQGILLETGDSNHRTHHDTKTDRIVVEGRTGDIRIAAPKGTIRLQGKQVVLRSTEDTAIDAGKALSVLGDTDGWVQATEQLTGAAATVATKHAGLEVQGGQSITLTAGFIGLNEGAPVSPISGLKLSVKGSVAEVAQGLDIPDIAAVLEDPQGTLADFISGGLKDLAGFGLDKLGLKVLGDLWPKIKDIAGQVWGVLKEVPIIGDYLGMGEAMVDNLFDSLGAVLTGQMNDFGEAPRGNVACRRKLPVSDAWILWRHERKDKIVDGYMRYENDADLTLPLEGLLRQFAPRVYECSDDTRAISIDTLLGRGQWSGDRFDIDDDLHEGAPGLPNEGHYLSAWKIDNHMFQVEVGFLRATGYLGTVDPTDPLVFEHEGDGERAFLYFQLDDSVIVEGEAPPLRPGNPEAKPRVVTTVGAPSEEREFRRARLIAIVGKGHNESRRYGWDRLQIEGTTTPRLTVARGAHSTYISGGLHPVFPFIAPLELEYVATPGDSGVEPFEACQIADSRQAALIYDRPDEHRWGKYKLWPTTAYPVWSPWPDTAQMPGRLKHSSAHPCGDDPSCPVDGDCSSEPWSGDEVEVSELPAPAEPIGLQSGTPVVEGPGVPHQDRAAVRAGVVGWRREEEERNRLLYTLKLKGGGDAS